MTVTLAGFVVLLAIAAICSVAGKRIAGGEPGGFVASIALGFVGTLAGPWLAQQLHRADPLVLQMSGQPIPIVWSITGAAVFVAGFHLISEPRWARS